MAGTKTLRRLMLAMVCLGVLTAGPLAGQAAASHFRGGDINYQQSGAPTNANFETTVSFRCTFFFASCPAVGTTVFLGGTDYGDGAFSAGSYVVLASNDAEDYFTARETHSHNYADTSRRDATYTGCCTLSSLLNNNDANWRLFTDVNLSQDTNSPKTSVPAVVNVGNTGNQTFLVPATDPGGQTLRWRLATDAEADGFNVNPPDYSVNPNTGLVTFNTTGKTEGLYHSSIVIEALSGGNVVSATLTTFLIRVGQTAGNQPPVYDTPPTPANGTEFTVAPGNNLSINLQASDPDTGDTVDIVPGPLPPGATFNDTPGNPVSGTFSFTPTAGQNGQDFVVNFTAQDGNGGSTFVSYTIKVRSSTQPGLTGRMDGKGSLTGTGGTLNAYAFILNCTPSSPQKFTGKKGSSTLQVTSVTSNTCTNDPGKTPANHPNVTMDTMEGSGTGTLGGTPVAVDWKFVDGGTNGANDSSFIEIRNASTNAVIFSGTGAPPGKFPGSTQATGMNTTLLGSD